MLKKLYEKSEIWFAVTWIIVYCVLKSVGDSLSASIGIGDLCTVPILLILSVILYLFVKNNGLSEKYGLCKSQISASKMLFYIPVLIFVTGNLWYGVALNVSPLETLLYILTMFCVGFLEEMIFRGFLFEAMVKDGIKSAVIISSVTFGIGHIVNLINGSGAELLPNILQVIYAIAIGFMFVMIYYRTKSMFVCIAAHSIFNALSIFANEAVRTVEQRILSCVCYILICGLYGLYIALKVKKETE
ncbi:MAG: CPBP family intramembrane metalloprotease [Lachnospiraceae bacterium]|nr:CPBP family intramembrane metalloprotease [Lachnospiraceae bacterium]